MSRLFPQALLALVFGILITGTTLPSFAATSGGGACPTGSNYLDLTSPQNGGGQGSVTLASLGITSCYYISAAGSDSNSGTSEASPWLHAPGMPSCSSTCAAVNPAAGNGFIFRGGDTWHTSTGSPTGMPWTFSHSGTSSNPIYIGVDTTWFSGSSFARPIFTMDNPLTTASPSSCNYDDTTTSGINVSGNYVTIDDFEFSGKCWGGSNPTGQYTLQLAGSNDIAINHYIHGWSVARNAGDDSHVMISPTGTTDEIGWNVIDGADSTFGATCTTPGSVDSGSCQATGFAIGYVGAKCYNIHHNVIRHVSNGIQCPAINIVHDNLFEYTWNPSFGGRHGNTLESDGGAGVTNFYFYNNVVHNVGNAVQLWPQASNMYIFNNVLGNSSNGGNTPPDPNCLIMSPPGSSAGSGAINVYFYNNTVPSTCHSQAFGGNASTPSWASGSTITFENNHIVGYTSLSGFFACDGGSSCSQTDNGGEVFQTTANATTQGYMNTNDYSPTSAGNVTVGAGLNATASCSKFSADSALCSGTTMAVIEASGNGGLIAVLAGTSNARSASGTWDSGGYAFGSGGNTPVPPTGLSAQVQ